MKKTSLIALLIAIALTSAFFAGCSDNKNTDSKASDVDSTSQVSSTSAPVEKTLIDEDFPQMAAPKNGDTIAILHTSLGDIKMKFFPDEAPKTVENFITHAKDGYYDGLTFHRVMEGFMIQGGDPNGNGTGGESIWGDSFEDEFSENVVNVYGSVAMANSGANTNGSQFFINQSHSPESIDWDSIAENLKQFEDYLESLKGQYSDADIDLYKQQSYNAFFDPSLVPDNIKLMYEKYGGNYFLDGAFNTINRGHAVFAQVFDGMDVVNAIAAVEVDADSSKPINDVIINSIEITEYNG
ncbi:MAG: peptidylprolyl isomerase [Clostridia bacterium]|nr:peptidylprolyl isomerase [Clostridia bacterium]